MWRLICTGFVYFVFLVPSLSANSVEINSLETKARRIDAHLILGDHPSALGEAKEIIVEFPHEMLAHEMLLRALAANGSDAQMMQEWAYILETFPMLAQKRILLEEMCLGVLKQGCKSDSIMTRLIGYLAIAQAHLPDAVDIIRLGLNDSNAQLRALNVELTCHYRDGPLVEEIRRMFHKEQSIEVRVAILKAIAKLQLTDMISDLTHRLEKNPRMPVSEKKETIATLALLREEISQEELKTLLKSGRTWQIGLGTAMMRKWQMQDEEELLWSLVEKGTSDVKIEALRTLGFLQAGQIPLLSTKCQDENPLIGITSSWALGFLDASTLEANFFYWVTSDSKQFSSQIPSSVRAMAASALMMHGKKTVPIAKKILKTCEDPFVRANIALHLLKLRVDVAENAQILYDFLHTTKEKLMWVEGHFPYVHLSTHTHTPLIPNKPEAANQSVRLEILNLLAIVEYQHAESAIREFLKEGRWEIAGLAAETLLQEGDESAVTLVRGMLNDSDKHVQTQAALMLAAWGRDPAALSKLIELYEDADRILKIKVLEALGFLGDEKAIPFLLERLKEPSGIFRMIAACVLLQTLYH